MKFLLLLVVVMAVRANEKLIDEFTAGNARFSANVYKELLKINHGNFMVCPLSVEVIMGLVYTGARGNTAAQLSTGLQLPNDKEKVEKIFTALNPSLQGTNDYTLTSANKVYVKNGFKINEDFKNTAVNVFKSNVQNVDFTNGATVGEINKWVEGQTENKIKNLLSAKDVDDTTVAVLVNAMYFEGVWFHKFKTTDTKKNKFYINKENNIEVDMMKAVSNFNYYESPELKAKFLKLLYAGNNDDMSMTIVLPDDKDGLSALEEHLDDVLTEPRYADERLHVEMPKFKIETSVPFTSILEKMGIVDAFKPAADFSGIAGDQHVYVTKVLQKTFVSVNEKGTTAAAATAVIAGLGSAPSPTIAPKEFIVDHPFMFYIKRKSVIVFIGRYNGQ